MKVSPLRAGYGVRIDGYDLRNMAESDGYPEIRALFEQHSLLFFPAQQIDEDDHYRIATLFGPYEDRSIAGVEKQRRVPRVSNIKNDGSLLDPNESRMLDLKTNMLWHTDSIFLPLPALANMLVGRCIPPSGTSTEFASTRMAWAAMPETLKSRIRNRYFRHQYSHSRRKVNANLAMEKKFTHWGEQVWKAIWKNPVNGEEALYFASHTCGVVGMDDDEALALAAKLGARPLATDFGERPGRYPLVADCGTRPEGLGFALCSRSRFVESVYLETVFKYAAPGSAW